ncbi:hypothetical protein ACWCQZ_41100 [Streptomyces sp. NPDC002285]
MIPEITIGAASLMGSLLVAAGLARWWVRPEPVAPRPRQLLRPIEALDKFETHCVVERRPTLHMKFRTGHVMCLDCRTELAATKEVNP